MQDRAGDRGGRGGTWRGHGGESVAAHTTKPAQGAGTGTGRGRSSVDPVTHGGPAFCVAKHYSPLSQRPENCEQLAGFYEPRAVGGEGAWSTALGAWPRAAGSVAGLPASERTIPAPDAVLQGGWRTPLPNLVARAARPPRKRSLGPGFHCKWKGSQRLVAPPLPQGPTSATHAATLAAMAPPATRRPRRKAGRRARSSPLAGAPDRSAEDWWWDRLAPSGSEYHLLQADSMLLVLPGLGPSRSRARRRVSRSAQRPLSGSAPAAKSRPRPRPRPEPAPVPEQGPDVGWGDRIPLEVLVQIFRLLVAVDGPMPFLGRYTTPLRVNCRWIYSGSLRRWVAVHRRG